MRSHVARVIVGKAGYAAVCLCTSVLLVVAGYAHKEVAAVVQIGKGVQISNSPSVGAMKIASTQAVTARVIGAKSAAGDGTAAASATPAAGSGAPAGEGTTVAPNAKYGIPCVY